MKTFERTSFTTLKRLPERGSFDAATIHGILDEGFVCHVGFVVDGQPFVIPTSYARAGDRIFIHGAAASRMLRSLSQGLRVCVTVTLVDGLVLARSAFHHSINYRSVVIFGVARVVGTEEEKMAALHAFTEHIVPGRWTDVREPDEVELKQTTVLSLELSEVSAKIRTGPPKDDERDYFLPAWAGELPLRLQAGAPVADAHTASTTAIPEYVIHYDRKVAWGNRPLAK